ncbi:hypothetical protein JKY79_02790 [Candidatus Babeliales bacterium]|nr:hypothetical protein [Candidatus Babeliales bacterium]
MKKLLGLFTLFIVINTYSTSVNACFSYSASGATKFDETKQAIFRLERIEPSMLAYFSDEFGKKKTLGLQCTAASLLSSLSMIAYNYQSQRSFIFSKNDAASALTGVSLSVFPLLSISTVIFTILHSMSKKDKKSLELEIRKILKEIKLNDLQTIINENKNELPDIINELIQKEYDKAVQKQLEEVLPTD